MSLLLAIVMSLACVSTELLQERYLAGQLAAQDLVTFARLTSPLPSDPINPRASRYAAAAHHRYIARRLEGFARREGRKNLMISIPYRHGKTEIAVRKFVPWLAGNWPDRSGIVITHTDTLAHDLGRDCRDVFHSAGYRTAFPKAACQLRDDSQAMDRLQTLAGGTWMFSGRGGMGGGFGAHWIIIDDFFKNAEEARSLATREHAWHCYISDCLSRLNEQWGGVLLIGTRKHEDDPQGRILDANNLQYDQRERDKWDVIRLPALAEEKDPLGRSVDEPLWPQRFDKQFWLDQRDHRSELVRQDFQVQGQCNPIPTEGKYFKKEWLTTYSAGELPKELREYAASDHALRDGQRNDRHCLLPAGLDAAGCLWIMPDLHWHRSDTLVMSESMIDLMAAHRFAIWFAAKDQISGSIGPFLHKRMRERQVYQYIKETAETKDLQESRAVSIRNRMAMGMVKWPKFAPWWPDAQRELLAFPNGDHDDLVAALALLGMGLDTMTPAEKAMLPQTGMPKPGTLAWVKNQNDKSAAEERAAKAKKGW